MSWDLSAVTLYVSSAVVITNETISDIEKDTKFRYSLTEKGNHCFCTGYDDYASEKDALSILKRIELDPESNADIELFTYDIVYYTATEYPDSGGCFEDEYS